MVLKIIVKRKKYYKIGAVESQSRSISSGVGVVQNQPTSSKLKYFFYK